MTRNDAQIARQWDAQIARQWAASFIKHADSAQIVDADEITAARYILATTTPPTMADVDWDDAVHAGLCAEHCDGGVVLMLGKEPEDDDLIYCRWISNGEMVFNPLDRLNLTPLPGTKIDLTPRREPAAPDHPVTLSSVEDYESAPAGTVVAYDDDVAVKRDDDRWYWSGQSGTSWSEDLADADPCTIVRWGK